MKKILILSVTAGNAHNACAKRMKDNLLSRDKDLDIKVIDVLKSYSTPSYTWFADGGYNLAVSKFPKIYNMFYELYRNASPVKRYVCKAQGASMSIINGLYQEIMSYKPDVIYCTHFYPAIAITNIRLKYNLPCKVILTTLDFTLEPFFEAAIGVDYLVLANEDFVEGGLRLGYDRSQLLPIGLPVDNNTFEIMDKIEARKSLGIDEKLPTILVMFGGGYWSGGYKIFNDLIYSLKGKKAQVIMINGKNKKDFDRIAKRKFEEGIKVVNVGFTDKVALYMSASDFIINKCGGGSAAEMVNKALPMLITENLPMQEVYNFRYLKERGCAFSFKNRTELKKYVTLMLDNESSRQEMVKNTLSIRKDGLNELAEFILAQPEADYAKAEENVNFRKVRRNVRKSVLIEHKNQINSNKKAIKAMKLQNLGGIK